MKKAFRKLKRIVSSPKGSIQWTVNYGEKDMAVHNRSFREIKKENQKNNSPVKIYARKQGTHNMLYRDTVIKRTFDNAVGKKIKKQPSKGPAPK